MHPLQQVERASVKGIAKAMQDDSAHVNQDIDHRPIRSMWQNSARDASPCRDGATETKCVLVRHASLVERRDTVEVRGCRILLVLASTTTPSIYHVSTCPEEAC